MVRFSSRPGQVTGRTWVPRAGWVALGTAAVVAAESSRAALWWPGFPTRPGPGPVLAGRDLATWPLQPIASRDGAFSNRLRFIDGL